MVDQWLDLHVARLSGEVLLVPAHDSWSVGAVKSAIEAMADIPVMEQQLILDLDELQDKQVLSSIACGKASLNLTLLRRSAERAQWLEDVRNNPRWLQHAPDHIRADREVATAAVRKNFSAMQSGCVADELRNDPEFVMAMACENSNALSYAGKELLVDRDFLIRLVKRKPQALRQADAIRNDKAALLEVMKEVPIAAAFLRAEVLADKEFVNEALEQQPKIREHLRKGYLPPEQHSQSQLENKQCASSQRAAAASARQPLRPAEQLQLQLQLQQHHQQQQQQQQQQQLQSSFVGAGGANGLSCALPGSTPHRLPVSLCKGPQLQKLPPGPLSVGPGFLLNKSLDLQQVLQQSNRQAHHGMAAPTPASLASSEPCSDRSPSIEP